MNFENFVKENSQKITCKKSCHVFTQGKCDDSLYFLKSGLLKAYYVSVDGKESIKSFIVQGNVICSLTAAYEKKKSSFSLMAIQDSQLFQISFDKVMRTAIKRPDIGQEVIEMLLNFSMKKEQREYELLSMSAEDRYRQLYEVDPQLIKTVTQNDIALYLGITPVALSRIKKRLNSDFVSKG